MAVSEVQGTINDKTLDCEIETGVVLYLLRESVFSINDKNLDYEIETRSRRSGEYSAFNDQ